MKIELAGKELPRNEKGDVKFRYLDDVHMTAEPRSITAAPEHVMGTFTAEEVVELVNRALYQLEYQAASHRKRGAEERAKMKLLKETLGKEEAKKAQVEKDLKGDKR